MQPFTYFWCISKVNTFMHSELLYHNKLDGSIHRLVVQVYLFPFISFIEINEDFTQTPRFAASDPGLSYLPKIL